MVGALILNALVGFSLYGAVFGLLLLAVGIASAWLSTAVERDVKAYGTYFIGPTDDSDESAAERVYEDQGEDGDENEPNDCAH